MAAIAYPSVVDVRPRPVRQPSARPRPNRGAGRGSPAAIRPVAVRPAAVRPAAARSSAVRPAADVYRRRRVVALAAAALVGAVLILLLRAAAGALGGAPLAPPAPPAAAAVQPAAAVTYVVRPGDTYWSIAVAMHGAGDVRATVDRLVAAQHGAPLRAGDTIVIP